ncbi:hypothetical protein NHX12_008948 [Muraenolepis orangiensis]|uniref:Uncharacterized protein n=1 Tax=Muraenolepis orangiensis TaxID=630683 RepID=A0A9Q0DNU0_9TELE|nr:hypothetical protein NHX12_008948 [Muraenolepis orangiensis]
MLFVQRSANSDVLVPLVTCGAKGEPCMHEICISEVLRRVSLPTTTPHPPRFVSCFLPVSNYHPGQETRGAVALSLVVG